jgi:adenosylmethionine-8-amino-7-oxononanoate aminotransferase
VTSGYLPLGGVLVGQAVLEPLEADTSLTFRHGYTYSGHPTACAAALAVLEIMTREDLAGRAEAIGRELESGLAGLAKEGSIAGYRGVGAIWAAVLPAGRDPVAVRDRMLDDGVIARPLGADVIAFCPPLVISAADINRCVEALAVAVR